MILNVWQSIRNFFINLFSNINWGNFIFLLTGIGLGFIICGIIYLIILLKSIKKADKINKESFYTEDIVKTNETNKIIRGAKDQFKEEAKDYSLTQKIDCVKEISWLLIKDIAKIYYPESKYPVYELTVDELIKLCYYITQRVDKVFQGRILKMLRGFKVSQVIYIIDTKKKIEDTKIVKASKKMKLGGFFRLAGAALNVVNPVYWIKKFMFSTSLNIGTNKIGDIIIDIVGQETAKVYSKHLFTVNDNIDEVIKDIEQELTEE